MKKNGFTLTEVLTVIAIIGIIIAIAVPSVQTINKNINKRVYNEQVQNIEAAAEQYASNRPEIFAENMETEVYVYELIIDNYIKGDIPRGSTGCPATLTLSDGTTVPNAPTCLSNPQNKKQSLNAERVLVKKETVGVTAEFKAEAQTRTSESQTLVNAVCQKINDGTFQAKTGSGSACRCGNNNQGIVVSGNTVTGGACIITGNEKNNYLKYEGVYFRVLGVYDVYSNGTLSVKLITDQTVDVE